jgi:hypothetical protein
MCRRAIETIVGHDKGVMPRTHATPLPVTLHGIRAGITRLCDLSITGIIEAARIFILVSPIVLSVAQIARAEVPQQATAFTADIGYRADAVTYGPFLVVSESVVEMNGATDETTPADFVRLLADHPGIRVIRIIDCPGTENDAANLSVARMIRKAGISTHVPADGSVRSGGVELFLAGVRRSADLGAEFGVHSWQDADGREARDVPASDPIHADYVRYYEEVGLPAPVARDFYAFTNRTGFKSVHYLTRDEIARFQITN